MTKSKGHMALIRALVQPKGVVARELNAVETLPYPQPRVIDLALERLIAVPIPAPHCRNDQFVFAYWEPILDALRSHSQ